MGTIKKPTKKRTPLSKKNLRPGWDEYFIDIAKAVSARATCLRRRYGAVVTKENIIVSTGLQWPLIGLIKLETASNNNL